MRDSNVIFPDSACVMILLALEALVLTSSITLAMASFCSLVALAASRRSYKIIINKKSDKAKR